MHTPQIFVSSATMHDSYVDFMRAERSAPTAVMMQVAQCLRSPIPTVCGVFEGGNDHHIYLVEIRKRGDGLGYRTERFECGGKPGVLEVFNKINPQFKEDSRAQFFVDKDLDDILGRQALRAINLFETRTYSFENYLVCSKSLEIVWVDAFGLQLQNSIFPLVEQKFVAAYKSFVDTIRPLMAWAIECRKNKSKINLNAIDHRHFKKLCFIDDDLNLSLPPNCREIFLKLTGTENVNIDAHSLQETETKLASLCPDTYLRGKYALYFFTSFCNSLINFLSQHSIDLSKKRNQINPELLLQYLSTRISLPAELQNFLNDNFSRLPKHAPQQSQPPR